jgi:hypothetical protein
VLVFACLAAGAWFVFDRSEVQPPLIAPANASPEARIAAAAETQTAPCSHRQGRPAGTAVEADANQREAVAPQFAGPAGEVQVVAFDTKAPVAGATVYCCRPTSTGSSSPRNCRNCSAATAMRSCSASVSH